MIRSSLYILSLLVLVSSCNLLGDKERGRKIARVYDEVLYESDLLEVLPSGLSPQDSLLWVQKYINSWGKEQLIIKKAEYNLADREKDFEDLVQQYRNDLLKFTYQQRYVDEHLDTVITANQIAEYYEQHQAEFELKENIVMVNYIILNSDATDLDDVKSWFRSESESDKEKLVEYANRYARHSSFGDSSWVRYNDLAKLVPLRMYNQQDFLNRNHYVELSDSTGQYFLEIVDYKIADDVSPLPYVVATIRNIILNKRKQEIIASMEERLVNDAYEKQDFEIY